MVALHNLGGEAPRLPGLDVETLQPPGRHAAFDLGFDFVERDGGLTGYVEYNTDLFDAATVERVSARLRLLLEAVADDPGRTVGELPLLSDAERHQVQEEWQGETLPVPDLTFVDLFEDQVARTPHATALVARDATLDFAALNDRANRLAHHLISLGVGPERVVAVQLPRTSDMLVALLAVLKAGGTQLSLDPELPAERRAFLLADAAPRTVLTADALRDAPWTGSPATTPPTPTGPPPCAAPTPPTSTTPPAPPAGPRASPSNTVSWSTSVTTTWPGSSPRTPPTAGRCASR